MGLEELHAKRNKTKQKPHINSTPYMTKFNKYFVIDQIINILGFTIRKAFSKLLNSVVVAQE